MHWLFLPKHPPKHTCRAQVPLFSWARAVPVVGGGLEGVLRGAAVPFASLAFRRSGAQFFLMDREGGGGAEPLLARMTRDHPVEVSMCVGACVWGVCILLCVCAYVHCVGGVGEGWVPYVWKCVCECACVRCVVGWVGGWVSGIPRVWRADGAPACVQPAGTAPAPCIPAPLRPGCWPTH